MVSRNPSEVTEPLKIFPTVAAPCDEVYRTREYFRRLLNPTSAA
jgi:hypothetical protein